MQSNDYNYSTSRLLFLFLSGIVLLFLIAPLLGMFISVPVDGLMDTLKDNEVNQSIGLTLSIAMVTTLVFAIFAIPFAYLMARKKFVGKNIIQSIVDLPIVIPHSAAGIAILGFISRDSILGKFAALFGLNLVGNPIGIAIAMAFISLPFLINAARNGFEAVPERLEKAALNLGASPTRMFFTISLPLARKSILSGIILMFARGMSEFGAIVIVAYHPMTTPVLIFERFNTFGLKYAQPVSVIFISICLIIFIIMRLIGNRKNYF